MTAMRLFKHPVLWMALTFAVLTALWNVTGAPLTLITQIAIYTLYALGVNLLVGYAGLVPFGASVFFGGASYAAAFFLLRGYTNDIFGIALTVVFSAVLGLILGALILRRTGLYFSLLTLACSQIAFEVVYQWTDVTGGENGLQGVPRPSFASDTSFHYFVLAFVLAGAWFLWALAHSPFGRALQAVRDNEQRARSLGFNVYGIRLIAFTIMAAVVGAAGALLTLLLQGAYANNLNWQHAGDALLMSVLGGVHHFLGPLWGAIAFILLENRLSAVYENWWLLFAPILMILPLVSPEGVQGLAQMLRGRARRRWTLIRPTIPPRPAVITPYASAARDLPAGQALMQVRALSKSFGKLVTAEGLDMDIHPYVLHSIIGPNGAGKTTLFNMLTGVLSPTAGNIVLDGRDITRLPMHARARLGVGRSFQILSVFPNLTVFENVRIAVQSQRGSLWRFFRDAHRDAGVNDRTWSILDAIGLVDKAALLAADLPHGAKRLLEIGVTLALDSRVLLLDEPLAGLAEADRIVVAALIKKLAQSHAVLLVEHDIDRLLAISDRVSVLYQGKLIADGKPEDVARDPAVIAAYLGETREGGLTVPRLPHVGGREGAKPLAEVRGIDVGYSGSTVLSGVSMEIREGEIVALLGRNGVGKTTLLRALTGILPLKQGAITLDGQAISGLRPYQINRKGISLVPEGRRLFPNLTVTENLQLAERPGGIGIEDVFELFPRLRTRQAAKADNLSGGERQMVAIARALMVPSRVVLLDEPFEGLAPAVVKEVMEALVKLRGRKAMVIVEHHADAVLALADWAYVLVNGQVAFDGAAAKLEGDHDLQARLLGIVDQEAPAPEAVTA